MEFYGKFTDKNTQEIVRNLQQVTTQFHIRFHANKLKNGFTQSQCFVLKDERNIDGSIFAINQMEK